MNGVILTLLLILSPYYLYAQDAGYSETLKPIDGNWSEKRINEWYAQLPRLTGVKNTQETKSYFSYCNPIRNGIDIHGIRDCQVLRDGDWWYMTATPRVNPSQKEIKGNIVEGVPLYKSKDLTKWTFVKYIVERPSPNSWYYRRFGLLKSIKSKENITPPSTARILTMITRDNGWDMP